MMPTLTHDAEADAVYVRLAEGRVERTVPLDDLRLVDYAADSSVIGVELLDVSDGVDLRGLPSAEVIAQLLPDEVRVLAS
jgi:uncharacterized protein YuzE